MLWCTVLFAFLGEVHCKFCVAVLFALLGGKAHHCIAHRASQDGQMVHIYIVHYCTALFEFPEVVHYKFSIAVLFALHCVIRCITASHTVHPKMGRWYRGEDGWEQSWRENKKTKQICPGNDPRIFSASTFADILMFNCEKSI